MPRRPKKTPPTTVRFTSENHAFVKAQAELHPDGQSGVINDAVAYYRSHHHLQDNTLVLFGTENDGEDQDS